MTVEHQHESVFVQCDGCSAAEEFERDEEFDDIVAKIKALGWKIVKVYRGWRHWCPDCVAKGRHAAAAGALL